MIRVDLVTRSNHTLRFLATYKRELELAIQLVLGTPGPILFLPRILTDAEQRFCGEKFEDIFFGINQQNPEVFAEEVMKAILKSVPTLDTLGSIGLHLLGSRRSNPYVRRAHRTGEPAAA